jgi:hypothetical protein
MRWLEWLIRWIFRENRMPSTYTTNDGIEQPAIGSQAGTWGTTVNNDFAFLDSAIDGSVSIPITTNYTLPTTNGAASNGRNKVIVFTGTLGADATISVTPNTASKLYFIKNATTGGYNLIISQGGGSTATIANGLWDIVYCNGAGSGASVASIRTGAQFVSPTITGTVSGNPTLPYVNAHTDGNVSISLAGLSTYTLDTTSLGTGANALVRFTGSPATSPCVVTLSPNTAQKILFVRNDLSLAADFSGFGVQIKQGTGSSVSLLNARGESSVVYADGTGATANCSAMFSQLFQAGPTMSSNDIPYWESSVGGMGLSGLQLGAGGPAVKVGARWFETCPNTAVTDAQISSGQFSVWLNESTNALTFRVRRSDGTYKTGTIALT